MLNTACEGQHVLVHNGVNELAHCDSGERHIATPDSNTIELFDTDEDLETRATALGLIRLPADD